MGCWWRWIRDSSILWEESTRSVSTRSCWPNYKQHTRWWKSRRFFSALHYWWAAWKDRYVDKSLVRSKTAIRTKQAQDAIWTRDGYSRTQSIFCSPPCYKPGHRYASLRTLFSAGRNKTAFLDARVSAGVYHEEVFPTESLCFFL